jgi:nucleotide-binding universal stress UspA family protein
VVHWAAAERRTPGSRGTRPSGRSSEPRGLVADAKPQVRLLSSADPAFALTELAREIGAEVIVLGSTRAAVDGRAAPGRLAHRLLHGSAPAAVTVAPVGYRGSESGLRRIGVGYDGRRESETALKLAARLARDAGVPLALWHVLEHSAAGDVTMWLASHETMREWAEECLEAAVRRLGDVTVAEAVLLEGHPADVLAAQAATVDLLVLGSRDYGPMGRVLLGSVSRSVMRTAPCPVLVVPRTLAGSA